METKTTLSLSLVKLTASQYIIFGLTAFVAFFAVKDTSLGHKYVLIGFFFALCYYGFSFLKTAFRIEREEKKKWLQKQEMLARKRLAELARVEQAEKERWNNLTFSEQCQEIAEEIRAGIRHWHLGVLGTKYLLLPINPNNPEEMGGGYRSKISHKEVKDLLESKRVANEELVSGVLKAFTNM